jgi:glycosyltransferase involved in cell wall biosynthesis
MKVAFVTNFDPSDLKAWSGIVFHMLQALKDSDVDVEIVGKLREPYRLMFRAKRLVKNVILAKNYLRDREPLALRYYAKQVKQDLDRIRPDVVLSPGTIPIAYLRTDKPIIFWTDATFDGMVNFYPEFTNLCNETLRNGRTMEQAALSNCRLAVYSSEWAAKTAIDNYNVEANKVKVVPFGANLIRPPDANEIRQAIEARAVGVCKLLFIGVDWDRKGGDLALSVVSLLNQRGLKAELHVVGCEPPSQLPAFVKRHGFLSKANRQQNEILSKLFAASEFLILPSKAECAGMVVAEASAYGLPAVTTDVGGMTTVVRDGVNGRTFDLESFSHQCADYIMRTLSSKEEYRRLCISAFDEYSRRLNWRTAVQSVLDELREGNIATKTVTAGLVTASRS